MSGKGHDEFGRLLRRARESEGLSRQALGRLISVDGSHIYRMEAGERRPSRSTALALAEALGVEGKSLDQWLTAAGFAAMPLLSGVRSGIRTRGAIRTGDERGVRTLWSQLEGIGLQESRIERLLRSVEKVGLTDARRISQSVADTFTSLADSLEAPVHTAVIPAAGGQHRLVAPHVMQRLILRAVVEAAESGISMIVLVLAPGTVEFLYLPLKEALDMAVVPSINLIHVVQVQPEGLGDAVLQTESLVSGGAFALLLPDDMVRERIGGGAHPRELHRMMNAFGRLETGASLLAVKPVPRSKMSRYGIAEVEEAEGLLPDVLRVLGMIEKPERGHPICESPRSRGIVGRYLLQPHLFKALHRLKKAPERPIHLTTALEDLRRQGQEVYGFEFKADRDDLGEVIAQAGELMGNSPERRD
jgi:UTP--glucose-1-phosphate uridylyltransferase